MIVLELFSGRWGEEREGLELVVIGKYKTRGNFQNIEYLLVWKNGFWKRFACKFADALDVVVDAEIDAAEQILMIAETNGSG